MIDTVKTWSPPEQLELIQAITRQLQGFYHFKDDNRPLQSNQIENSDLEDWAQLSQSGLEYAYGADEPEYSLTMLREQNPTYEAR